MGKYIPEILLGLTTCAIGVCGSALISDENRKKICLISGIIAFVLAILYLSNLYIGIRNDEAAKETRATMFQSICQQYFARGTTAAQLTHFLNMVRKTQPRV